MSSTANNFDSNASSSSISQEIANRLDHLSKKNDFGVLGVPRNASPDEINKAHKEALKAFHPDQPYIRSNPDLIGQATKLLSSLNVARRRLISRSRADVHIATGNQKLSTDQISEMFSSEIHFREGRTACKQGNLHVATEKLIAALAIDPDDSEAKGWLAWAQYLSAKRKGKVPASTVAKISVDLQSALDYAPQSADLHYFMGELHLARRDYKSALGSFRETIRINPGHIGAKRQIRLIGMRGHDKVSKTSTKNGKSGLFASLKDKLFSR